MGCGGSKVDDLPLVTLCRERRDFVRKASEHRYALAAAHISYFRSLHDVGEALRRFSDEELVFLSASAPGSPVLTLPSDDGKGKPRRRGGDGEGKKSSTTMTPSSAEEDGAEGSHLHLSGSDSDSDSGHIQIEESPEAETSYPNPYPYSYPFPFQNSYAPAQNFFNPGDWGSPPIPTAESNTDSNNSRSYMFFSKRSGSKIQSMVYEEPETDRYSSWYAQYNSGGLGRSDDRNSPPPPPAPPSPPMVSTWDYLNFFDTYDSGGYQMKYGYGSNASSPDSNEVREREGIPELEDETDPEASRSGRAAARRKKKNKVGDGNEYYHHHHRENSNAGKPKRSVNSAPKQWQSEAAEITSSSGTMDTSVSKISVEDNDDDDDDGEEYQSATGKRAVSFEGDEVAAAAPNSEIESSKRSSVAALTVNHVRDRDRTRDLQEVVKEIRDEFEAASGYGKEVAVLLEVGKLPYYQPRANALKGTFRFPV